MPVTGFVLLVVLIFFVFYWMAREGRQLQEADVVGLSTPDFNLAGFRSNLFYLPDDPLLGFVEIPAGPFLMGSNPAFDRLAYENERWSETQRQGTVNLERYYLGRLEVTVSQFKAFLATTGADPNRANYGDTPDYPVANLTWTEALAYCRWLQEQLLTDSATPEILKSMLQTGWRITLPTEAQWEKAARGEDGRVFPWGNQVRRDRANFNNSVAVKVGSFTCPECVFPVADMSGNVWEMTRSPYQPYPYNESDEDLELGADALWVMRGGSYSDTEANVRSAVRGGVDPGVRNSTIGFRIALSR
ncbi:MAG: SUMF1/EgtB/PvdO family nonheme iron enzyme [Pseudohongiellaceae bacterium]